jgi:hypothetical protein
MKMSVYRHSGERREMDHLEVIQHAVDDETTQMIMHAHLHAQTVLVGLDMGESIVKPAEAGDDRRSFVALYDNCVSLREFRRMRELKVNSTTEFPPHIYQIDVAVEPSISPTAHLRLKAHNENEVRTKLANLVNTDEKFRSHLVQQWVRWILEADDDARIFSKGALRIVDDAPADVPDWEFKDRE